MTRQVGLIGAVLATVLANTGCVSYCHRAHQAAWDRGADHELPAPCRGQVYVFMVHGFTPTSSCGLDGLRHKLAESGFAKVGVAELAGALCVPKEIEKIRKCEPDARFVLIGYDLGGAAAVCVARDLSKKGVPVEAVVLLDPVKCGEPCGLRTLLVTSGTTVSSVPHTERLVVPDATHAKLPAHPLTAGAIVELLKEIATRDFVEAGDTVPEWSYKHAPEMRPTAAGKGGADWDFLADKPGTPDALAARVATQSTEPLAPTTPALTTSAGPVLIKR
jgi:pimeloyl-ACP methyl ester carboxylesterase